jgi:hypothetical protein
VQRARVRTHAPKRAAKNATSSAHDLLPGKRVKRRGVLGLETNDKMAPSEGRKEEMSGGKKSWDSRGVESRSVESRGVTSRGATLRGPDVARNVLGKFHDRGDNKWRLIIVTLRTLTLYSSALWVASGRPPAGHFTGQGILSVAIP